ncbi:MAG: ABC transporter ATP-binding protein [Anaerolineae bacterium]|nr:ABC transporter ATP-binding protein [Anaerolineae bacterium]
MKSLRRMLSFVAPYKGDAVWALVLLLGVVAADLGIPRLTQRVIDDGIAAGNIRVVVTTSLLMMVAAVVSALFSIGNTILSVRVGQNLGADLRSAIVRKVQTFSFGNLDDLQTGQLIVRATSDVTQVQMMMMLALRIMTRAPLWLLGSVIMLAINSPQLVPLMAILMAAVLVLIAFFLTRARPLFLMVQEKLDALNEVLQENLSGIRVVKAFVRAAHEIARFDVANDELMAQQVRVMQTLAFLFPTLTLIINFGIAGVIWFGGGGVEAGTASVGEIVASFNYLTFSLFPMVMLAGMMGPLSAADASAGRILEVLDSEPEVKNQPKADLPAFVAGRVVFEDVCFSYDGAACAEPVLNHVDLVAEAGQTVAILGATGSGKSTLIHLIPRFYDVSQGRILLDGIDIRDLPLDVLRAQVGIAMQEAVLFSGTIRDNIRYGRPDASDEAVVEAAKAAQAHDFIMAFPDGYDTLVGQRGVNLSGGQKQRLSIARALLVRPRVLILDDSTSAVDFETEAKIEVALAELLTDEFARSTTVFVIAQRISTVLNADKIVVLDEGRVSAIGSHDTLMESSAIYQEIYASQLGGGVGTAVAAA